jgi:hypothetical protein
MSSWMFRDSLWLTSVENLGSDGEKGAISFGKSISLDLARTNDLGNFYNLLQKLSQRSWRTRVWVLQGYVLSKSVILIYGQRHVEGDLFHLVIMLAWGMREYLLRQSFSDYIQLYTRVFVPPLDYRLVMFMLEKWSNGESELKYLMHLLYFSPLGQTSQATDPRDRVFALLELVEIKCLSRLIGRSLHRHDSCISGVWHNFMPLPASIQLVKNNNAIVGHGLQVHSFARILCQSL